MTRTSNRPIGVFDSGVGGLSVLREIRHALPGEDLIYVADSAHAPYGDRPRAFVQDRAATLVQFLVDQGAKAVVVACNTATGIAIDGLRARFSVPLVAIEPAVKPAVAKTASGVVGILATSGTVSSPKFTSLVAKYRDRATIVVQACPGLVERVELGDLEGPETRALLEQYVLPLIEQNADTLVLGCTHYPFLEGVIRSIVGPRVSIIDPAFAVALELRRRLETAALLSPNTAGGTEHFWTSGAPEDVQRVVALLWKPGVPVERLPAAVAGDQSPREESESSSAAARVSGGGAPRTSR